MSLESILGSAWLTALHVCREQLNCLKVHIAFPTRCELVGLIWESNCCSWLLLWCVITRTSHIYFCPVYECSNWELSWVRSILWWWLLPIPTIFNWRIIIQGLYVEHTTCCSQNLGTKKLPADIASFLAHKSIRTHALQESDTRNK